MKGITLIAEVLFLAVVITLIFLVYAMATPIIGTMQTSGSFDQAKAMMSELDAMIQEVASDGKGARRSLYVNLGSGTALLDEATDTLRWTMSTGYMIISPRSMQRIGNLVVGSNLGASAYSGNFSGQSSYVLENDVLRVYVLKVGSEGSPQAYDMSSLLLHVYNKKLSMSLPMERLEISVDGSPESMTGTGYTELLETGHSLPRGEVVAHMSSGYEHLSNYTVSFILEAGADFLTIEAGS